MFLISKLSVKIHICVNTVVKCNYSNCTHYILWIFDANEIPSASYTHQCCSFERFDNTILVSDGDSLAIQHFSLDYCDVNAVFDHTSWSLVLSVIYEYVTVFFRRGF
jgi:hypothetical protein